MGERITSKEHPMVTRFMTKEFTDVMVKSWTPQSEVWSFKYGNDLLGIMNAMNGSLIMHNIRKQLNLRPYARVTCYAPIAALSYILTDGFHANFITRQILGFESCPICIVIKAGLMQASLGVAYPFVLAPLIGFYISDRLLTYPVPSIHRAPKELFNLWLKMITKNPRFIYASITIQVVAACLVTSEKQSFFYNFIGKKN
ncbi:unnamed protein product [Larinioides sclopetarius]|uniref:Uncharacterized protein n=1 Tax=Larinioides sclopetarius TaxID=280406 RepID=A0AAV2A9H0_9ARAC